MMRVLLLIFISLSFTLNAQELQRNIELKNNWLQLESQQWIPLHWRDSSKVKVAGVYIPEEANLEKDFFVIHNIGITDVYVNNNFYSRYNEKQKVVIPLSEMSALAHSKKLFVTVFAEKGYLSLSTAMLGRELPPRRVTGNTLYHLFPRSFDSQKDQVLIIFYALTLILVMLKVRYYRVFNGFFNWFNMLRNIPPEENMVASTLNKPSIYFVLLLSAVIGVEITIYHIINNGTEVSAPFLFIAMTLVTFTTIITKYYFLKVFGSLIGVSIYYKRHYFEYLRTVFFIALIYALPMLLVLLQEQALPLSLEVSFLLFCFIGVIRILLITARQVKFTFLYLFSYICTSEIVPILLVTKFLF